MRHGSPTRRAPVRRRRVVALLAVLLVAIGRLAGTAPLARRRAHGLGGRARRRRSCATTCARASCTARSRRSRRSRAARRAGTATAARLPARSRGQGRRGVKRERRVLRRAGHARRAGARRRVPERRRELVLPRSRGRPLGALRPRRGHPAGDLRLHADPRRVAIGGISMGGFGAYDLARLRPQRFCAVGGHSAALWLRGGDSAAGAFDDAADFARHDVVALARGARPNRVGAARGCGSTAAPRIRSARAARRSPRRSGSRCATGRASTRATTGARTSGTTCASTRARWRAADGGPSTQRLPGARPGRSALAHRDARGRRDLALKQP